jgi:hypothetical protein
MARTSDQVSRASKSGDKKDRKAKRPSSQRDGIQVIPSPLGKPLVHEMEEKEIPAVQLDSEIKSACPSDAVVPLVGNGPNLNKDRGWNPKAFPLLKRHANRKFPQITYYLPHSFSWTQGKIDIVDKYHPVKLDDVWSRSDDNEHPLCAAFRSMCEAYALSKLIREIREDQVIDDCVIMDVGGAARRHASNKRKFVWSCIPKFDARDFVRTFDLPSHMHCTHRWQDCDCKEGKILASMSVHSLYYIPESDILIQLLKQIKPVHYAVMHIYPEKETGEMMGGEMEYIRKDGMIWVKAKGNLTWYHHRDTDWLNSGHYSDANGTLEWEYVRRFGDVAVIRFCATSEVLVPPPPAPCPSAPVLKISPVVFEATGPKLIEDVELFSKIVNESLNYGAPINAKNHASFLAKVQRKGHEHSCDMLKLVTYASYKYVNQSIVLQEATVNLLDAAEKRKKFLDLSVDSVNYKLVFTIVVGLIAMIAIAAWQSQIHLGFIVATKNSVFIFIGLAFMLVVGMYNVWKKPVLRWLRRNNPFVIAGLPLHNTSIFWSVKALANDYCCKLPDKPLDPSKCVFVKLPREYSEPCEEKPAAKAMVYHPSFAPYFPRKCLHNARSSLLNKLLNKIPSAGEYSFSLHPSLIKVAKKIRNNVEPLSFEEYVSRFPGAKQRKLRDDEKKKESEHIRVDRFNESSFFTKFEAYVEPKYPRPIVSGSVEFNFSTGRWLIPITELFAELLPSNIMFPLHGDAFEIGRFHETHMGRKIKDCDFSSFDSSQRAKALQLIIEFLRLCGVPEPVLTREAQDMLGCLIRTRAGMKVLAKDVRFSGRSATLFGNSLITINTMLSIFGDNLAALLAKGDDAVLYLFRDVDDPTYIEKFLHNGLVAKLRTVGVYDVEFCSSIFVPFAEGTVLIPKPGKLLAKTFWCKHMHYTDSQIEAQFASIVKGLLCSIMSTPGLRGLCLNPVFLAWSRKVEAHRQEYNEYTDRLLTTTADTVAYMVNRYQVEATDLIELEQELRSGFPIRLESHCSEVMIEKDWGVSNDGEHLTEHRNPLRPFIVFGSPLFEEIVRWYFPVTSTILMGGFESLVYETPFNLIMHIIYALISFFISPILAFIVHMLVNLAGPNTNILHTLHTVNHMVKNNNKNRKTATISVAVKEKKASPKKRAAKLNASPYLVSKMNPFLPATNGIRAPDSFGYPTATAVLRGSSSPGTRDSQYLSVGYTPFIWANNVYSANVGSATSWASTVTTASAQAASLNDLATLYRTVSWGLRITCDASLTESQGHLWIAHVPINMGGNAIPVTWPTTEAQIAQLPLSEKFSLVELAENPLLVTGRAFDDGCYRFRTATSADDDVTQVGLESSTGWCAIVVLGFNIPTGSPINVETIQHVEYLQKGSSAYGFIDAMPGVYLPQDMQVASAIDIAAPVGIIERSVDTIEKASHAFTGVVGTASRLMGAMAPAFQAAGYLMRMRGNNRQVKNTPFLALGE